MNALAPLAGLFPPLPIFVEFEPWENDFVTWVGKERNAWALSRKLNHVFPATAEEGERNDIDGAGAEYAAAKWLGHLYKPNIGKTRDDDVGPVQVRLRRRLDGKLILRPRDKPMHLEDPFVFATGTLERGFTLRGWTVMRAGIEVGVLCDPGNQGAECWEVPQRALRPMCDLVPRMIRGNRAGWAFVDF